MLNQNIHKLYIFFVIDADRNIKLLDPRSSQLVEANQVAFAPRDLSSIAIDLEARGKGFGGEDDDNIAKRGKGFGGEGDDDIVKRGKGFGGEGDDHIAKRGKGFGGEGDDAAATKRDLTLDARGKGFGGEGDDK